MPPSHCLLHQREDHAARCPGQSRDVPVALGTRERRRLGLAVVQQRMAGRGPACRVGQSVSPGTQANGRRVRDVHGRTAGVSRRQVGIGYSGDPIPHKYPGRDINARKGLFPGVQGVSGLAVWPDGRLVALQCDDEGEFATVAVVPPGSGLSERRA